MNPENIETISCKIIAEFEEDASGFVEDLDSLSEQEPSETSAASLALGQQGLFPPSKEAAAAARKFWLQIIRRFTEHSPGKKNRLQVKGATAPNHAKIIIEAGRHWYSMGGLTGTSALPGRSYSGAELEISDKWCVVLAGQEEDKNCQGESNKMDEITETLIPVPWTDIVNLRFELTRVKKSEDAA
jgi:hypothetical protein